MRCIVSLILILFFLGAGGMAISQTNQLTDHKEITGDTTLHFWYNGNIRQVNIQRNKLMRRSVANWYYDTAGQLRYYYQQNKFKLSNKISYVDEYYRSDTVYTSSQHTQYTRSYLMQKIWAILS